MKTSLRLLALLAILAIATQTSNAQVVKVINDKVGIGTNSPAHKLHVNGDVYALWHRINGSRGLYSQTYGTYFYVADANYWLMRSNRGMILRDQPGTTRGYLYHDAGNSFGLLDRDGNWTLRTVRDSYARFAINNIIRFTVLNSGQAEVHTSIDANGGSGSGSFEIANALRLDANEIITNTGTNLYIQHDNNGDLYVDNGTFHVDASINQVGFTKAYDRNNSAYYLDPSSISRMSWVLPQSDNAGFCGSSASTWGYGYFYRLYRTYEYSLSDARAKENVRPINNALDKILQLNGKLYDFKKGAGASYGGFSESTAATPAGRIQAEAAQDGETAQAARVLDPAGGKVIPIGLASPNGQASGNSQDDYPQDIEAEHFPEVTEPVFPSNASVEPEELTARESNEPELSAADQQEYSNADQSQDRMRKDNYGFIAQEVLQVVPEVVDYDVENDVYSMSYTAIIPLLVESIKEQQQMIESQQKEIDLLKTLIESK